MPKCLHCNEYHTGRSNSKYCSDKCRYEARQVGRACVECGNEVTGTKKKIFCCVECRVKFHNRKKLSYTTIKHVNCKYCGKSIFSKRNKIYCNETCRNRHTESKLKEERKSISNKYSTISFEDFGHMDTDNVDIVMAELSVMKYDKVRLQEHMRKYGIEPRAKIVDRQTIKNTKKLRMNIVCVNELLDLYNIKIAKFRTYPTIGMYNTVIGVANVIKIARKLLKEKQCL